MNDLFYVVNVEAAIFHGSKWLLGRRSLKEDHAAGDLALIGGKVERAQDQNYILEETVKREIMEEVGISVHDNMRYVKSSSFITSDNRVVIDIVFLCEYKDGEAKAVDPDELSGVLWLTLREIEQNSEIKSWTKESLMKADKIRVKDGTGDFRL